MASKLRVVWALLIVSGAALSVVPTLGFTLVTADRGVSITTASDSNALLALEATGTTVRTTTSVPVAKLRNNLDRSLTVTYRVSVADGELSTDGGSTTRTLPPGGTGTVGVACARLDGSSGVTTVTVSVESADGGSVQISDATLTVSVRYDCSRRAPPGNAVAYDDADRDLQYDDGETTYTADQLAGEFEREGVDLVIDTDRTIDAGNSDISIKTRSVTVFGATLRTNKKIELEAESGAIDLRSATLDSKNGEITLKGSAVTATDSTISTNKKIELEAESGVVDVTGATLDSKNGEITLKGKSVTATDSTISTNKKIELEAESGNVDIGGATLRTKNAALTVASTGALDATGATLSAQNGAIELESAGNMTLVNAVIETGRQATATLNTASATLAVDGLSVRDRDATLTYDPAGATVTGTPADGTVSPS